MKTIYEIIITTTPTFGSHKVKAYLKPIFACIVTEIEYTTDLAIAKNELLTETALMRQICCEPGYNNLIYLLKEQAFELGSNAIVDFKTNIEVITKGNKPLYLLSANGTAVTINISKMKLIHYNKKLTQNIKYTSIRNLKQRKKLIKDAFTSAVIMNDLTWDYISENSVYELGNKVLDAQKQVLLKSYISCDIKLNSFNRTFNYFKNLTKENQFNIIYLRLISEKDETFVAYLYELIDKLKLVDYDLISNMLSNDDPVSKKRALQIVNFDRQFYDSNDIKRIKKLIHTIIKSYQNPWEKTQKRVKPKQNNLKEWICECGKQYGYDKNICDFCGKDVYGFDTQLINPDKAIDLLNEKADLISEILRI